MGNLDTRMTLGFQALTAGSVGLIWELGAVGFC